MKTILVINYKGGVGKSTIAVNLAHAFKAEITTYLMDMDSQNSLSIINWDAINSISIEEYNKMDAGTEGVVVIDSPPYLVEGYDAMIKRADYIIIPTKASFFDLASCRHTVDIIYNIMQSTPSIKAGILLNMTKPGTSLTGNTEEALQDFPIPLMKNQLSDRVSFIRSIALKDGIYSTGDVKAEKEFNNLVKEILLKLS